MITFDRIFPTPGEITTEAYIAQLDLASRAPQDRPYLVLNMIVSLDGRAAVHGHTEALQNRADHELFHALRRAGDAVLVGAATIRAEGYGVSEDPVVIASNSLDLPTRRGVLRHPENRVLIITESDRELQGAAAEIGYLRCDLTTAIRRLRSDHGIAAVICEGGPHLNGLLFAAGLVDEVFATVASRVVSGDAPLTMVHGEQLAPPVELEPIAVLHSGGFLFTRYRVL